MRYYQKERLYIVLSIILCVLLGVVFIGGGYVLTEEDTEEPVQTEIVIHKVVVYYPAPETEETEETEQETTQPSEENISMTLTATAYCSCMECCGKTDGITATGTQATAGRTIAVDPKVIPYGSKVIIGGNTYIAEDCGGAIKGNKVDIYFNTHDEALEWGRKTVEAVVITEASNG